MLSSQTQDIVGEFIRRRERVSHANSGGGKTRGSREGSPRCATYDDLFAGAPE
jgi:hypothetical protein